MKNSLIVSTLLAAASSLNATTIFEETFDYSVTGTGSGSGSAIDILQTAGYSGNGGGGYLIADGTSDVFDSDLDPLAYQDNSLTLFSGRSLSDLDRLNGLADTTDQTYYFSYTFQYADSSTLSAVRINVGGALFRIDVNGDTFVSHVNSNGGSNSVTLTHDTEYFVIGSFTVGADANPGNDQYTIGTNIYSAANIASLPTSEPITWQTGESEQRAETTGDTGIAFIATGGTSNWESFRIGTTYADVAVPEPSSYALISGFLALGWIMLRRRK